MNKLTCLLVLVASAFLFASHSAAIPVDIAVDFRDAPWDGGNHQHSIKVGDITVSALPSKATLWQDSRDGFGIRLGERDEIDGVQEELKISIDGGMYLTGAWVTDLFDAPDGAGNPLGEHGIVEINGTSFVHFYGEDAHQANGELFVDFGGNTHVEELLFYTAGFNCNFGGNEFSVAGFTSVPEPATLLLVGGGLLLIGAYRRRLK